jgi:hypothetical protein
MLRISHTLRPENLKQYFLGDKGKPYLARYEAINNMRMEIGPGEKMHDLFYSLYGFSLIPYGGFLGEMFALNNIFYTLIHTPGLSYTQGICDTLFIRYERTKFGIVSTPPPQSIVFQDIPDLPPFYYFQAITEAIRAIKDFKRIVYEALESHMDNPLLGMNILFGNEEHYTRKIFDDKNFDWLGAMNNEFRKNSPNPYTKLYVFETYRDMLDDAGSSDKACKVLREPEWLPLETAWNVHRRKHNITDTEIIESTKQAEEEERIFIEQQKKEKEANRTQTGTSISLTPLASVPIGTSALPPTASAQASKLTVRSLWNGFLILLFLFTCIAGLRILVALYPF